MRGELGDLEAGGIVKAGEYEAIRESLVGM